MIVPEKSAGVSAQAQEDPEEPETSVPAASVSATTAAQPQSTTVPVSAATVKPATTTAAAKAETTATTWAQKPATTAAATTTATTTTAATTTAAATTAAAATEPQELRCTFSVECGTVFQHLENLAPGKLDALPANGVILPAQSVSFTEGESVFDVLQRVCRENDIPMEASYVPLYHSAYVEGISNLYEFDCGEVSGWMYRVNGSYPNFGCSRYTLHAGDVVEFRYTCDLGADIGGKNNYS